MSPHALRPTAPRDAGLLQDVTPAGPSRRGIAARRLGALVAAAAIACGAGSAAAQSGLQVTPDGKRVLVSKDLGGQRWAITRNPDGSVTGNVFFPGGGAPQFVWCRETSRTATESRLSCSGADACPLAPCGADEWVFIADVPLPLSFFGLGGGASDTASGGSTRLAAPAAPVFPEGSADRTARTAAAGSPSGIQITPEGSLPLLSKDVGDQRWAISRNEDGTVTGNVFFPGGGEPQFVWCEQTGTAGDSITFRCSGAAPCPGGSTNGCAGTGWSLIAEVPLPASFFQPRSDVRVNQVVDELVARYGEDGAFDAVVLALDRGYALRQIVRAALSGRLLATGVITARGGGAEPPAGPGPHLFTAAEARASAGPQTIDEFRTHFRTKTEDHGVVIAIVILINFGYDLDQIVQFILGSGRIKLSPPSLVDDSGRTVPPARGTPDDPPISGAYCGDALADTFEECDRNDIKGATCEGLGLGTGLLDCKANCTLDRSGCTRPGVCGNGVLEGLEQCDGANLGGATCLGLGFTGGTLACSAGCAFDKRGCTELFCGNGTVEGLEQCDGANLNGATCQSLGFAGGTLTCSAGCAFDKHACTEVVCPLAADDCPARCGNGKREGNESCDGADLGGATCQSQGFASGTLACTSGCGFDTSACVPVGTCTGGTVACEGGCIPPAADCCEGEGVYCAAGSVCVGGGKCCPNSFPQVCGNSCLPAGALCCQPGTKVCGGTCIPDGASCCGNGVAEPGEQCDGADLNGATCSGSGSVSCTGACTIDRSACQRCPAGAFECGNSCAPNGSVCCSDTSTFCDAGDVCQTGGLCCPGSAPTLCGGKCYAAGIVCCGTYACNAGHVCLGNNQCG